MNLPTKRRTHTMDWAPLGIGESHGGFGFVMFLLYGSTVEYRGT